MATPSELIERTKSENAVDRIDARIQLLRQFPSDKDQEVKKTLYFDLWRDVENNREQAIKYVFNLPDLNSQAYAIMVVDGGLGISQGSERPSIETQKRFRKDFVNNVEGLVGELENIENLKSRLEVANIIAREGHYKQGLIAVDEMWNIGWDKNVSTSIYSYGIETVAESLEKTVLHANSKTVKRRALNHISQIPKAQKRKERLIGIITSKDPLMAVEAVDLYVEKVESLSSDRHSVALEAIMARMVSLGGEVLSTTSQPAVERAFEHYIKLIPAEKRLSQVHYLLTDNFKEWINSRKQEYPKGLCLKVVEYLDQNMNKIDALEDEGKRKEILLEMVSKGQNKKEIKAIDYLAQTDKNGVKNIAELYNNADCQVHLSAAGQDKITEWALKYTREFVNLENKNLARSVLWHIAGSLEPESGEGHFGGDGEYVKEKETGRYYNKIAAEELEKLPKEITSEDRLKEAFEE